MLFVVTFRRESFDLVYTHHDRHGRLRHRLPSLRDALPLLRQIIASGAVPQKLHDLAYEVSRHDLNTDPAGNLNADIAFHTYLVEAAGSPRLVNMYETLLYEVKLCIFQWRAFVPPRPENVLSHYKLLQAMEAGDLLKALSCLREHIASAIEAYQSGLLNRKKN